MRPLRSGGRRPRSGSGRWLAAWLLLATAACDLPRDPRGTSERVRGGVLRAGITANKPWTTFEDRRPGGIEVGLLTGFAARIGAGIEWFHGSETTLLEALGRGELDVVIGGLTDDTPWSHQVGLTRPYLRRHGRRRVIAVAPGENRWVLELDRYLQDARTRARTSAAVARADEAPGLGEPDARTSVRPGSGEFPGSGAAEAPR